MSAPAYGTSAPALIAVALALATLANLGTCFRLVDLRQPFRSEDRPPIVKTSGPSAAPAGVMTSPAGAVVSLGRP